MLLIQNITLYIFTISEFLFHQTQTLKNKIKRLCQQDAVAKGHRNFQLTLYKPIKIYIAYRTVILYAFQMKIVHQWKHTVLTVCT